MQSKSYYFMKKYIILILLLSIGLNSCKKEIQNVEAIENALLSPTEFITAFQDEKEAIIIDVRTPEEFAKGHLENAQNINWNSEDFELKISTFKKDTPLFVYCMSGGRSASATEKLRSLGFTKVYELDGGILKWRNEGLEEVKSNHTKGLSLTQFQELLIGDKLILVDFYADWCVPCQKLKPHLDAIAHDMKDKVTVIRINTDDNQELAEALNIDGIPVLQVYKYKQLKWNNVGYVEKAEILKHLQ